MITEIIYKNFRNGSGKIISSKKVFEIIGSRFANIIFLEVLIRNITKWVVVKVNKRLIISEIKIWLVLIVLFYY